MAIKRGFSLVELMVSIAILSVVAAGATVAFQAVNQGVNAEIVRVGQRNQALGLEQLLRVDLERHGQGLIEVNPPCQLNYDSERTPAWKSSCQTGGIAETHGLMLCHRDAQNSQTTQTTYHVENGNLCRNTWKTQQCAVTPDPAEMDCVSIVADGLDGIQTRADGSGSLSVLLSFEADLGLSGTNREASEQIRLSVNPRTEQSLPIAEALDATLTVASGASFGWILTLDRPASEELSVGVDPGSASCSQPCEATFRTGEQQTVLALSAATATQLRLRQDNPAIRLGRNNTTQLLTDDNPSQSVRLFTSDDEFVASGEAVLVTLRLTEPASSPQTFNLDTSGLTCGIDYQPRQPISAGGMPLGCGTLALTIPSAGSEVQFRLVPANFTDTGSLTLSVASGPSLALDLGPRDDLPEIRFVSASASVWEPVQAGALTSVPIQLQASPAPVRDLTVRLSADSTSTLGACGGSWRWGQSTCDSHSITWAAGQREKTVPMQIVQQSGSQHSDRLILAFDAPKGYRGMGQFEVILNEYAALNFAQASGSISKLPGASASVSIQLIATPPPTQDLTVQFSHNANDPAIQFPDDGANQTWQAGVSTLDVMLTVGSTAPAGPVELSIQRVQGLGVVGAASSSTVTITAP